MFLFGLVVGLGVMFFIKEFLVKLYTNIVNWVKKVIKAMFGKGE